MMDCMIHLSTMVVISIVYIAQKMGLKKYVEKQDLSYRVMEVMFLLS
jgi:uncharacterized membrane protein (UPF0127 family)